VAERDAEVEVDEALARALIAARFPALDSRSLRRVGKGWDNVVWATGDGVAFRFPRRWLVS
jgi:aminoglycoside phosphotransferase (APT) family kinase protein